MKSLGIEETIVSSALECVENISRSSINIDAKKSFKARARAIPSDLFTRGFTYSIVYIAARSSAYVLNRAFGSSKCSDIIDSLSRSDLRDEEMGYALYGAVMIYVLKQLNIVKARNLSDLIRESLNNPTIFSYSMIIAEWIKRFAEAYIETE